MCLVPLWRWQHWYRISMVHFVEQCFDSPSLISDKCCHLTLYLSQMEPCCERIILAAWSFEQRWSGSWNFFYFLLKLWLFFDAQALPHYFLCPRVLGPLVSCRPCPPGDPIAWHWASLQFHDPSRIKETQLINKSLMSLKDCIRNRALSALNIGELVNFPFLDFIRRIHCRGRYSSLYGILIDVGHLWLWPLL